MPSNYRDLVLNSLKNKTYPVLKEYVLIDVFYKLLPHIPSVVPARSYNRLHSHPINVYKHDAHPFRLSYLLASPHDKDVYHLYHVDPDSLPSRLDSQPLQCISVKLTRSYLDHNILHRPSASFEEEIYHFITLLNFDVPRIAAVLNRDFLVCTRILPQSIRLTPFHYDLRPVRDNKKQLLREASVLLDPAPHLLRRRFGPPSSGCFPLRSLLGRLSECSSTSILMSLDDNIGEESRLTYLHHYVESANAIVPLAYNPLENPVVHL